MQGFSNLLIVSVFRACTPECAVSARRRVRFLTTAFSLPSLPISPLSLCHL